MKRITVLFFILIVCVAVAGHAAGPQVIANSDGSLDVHCHYSAPTLHQAELLLPGNDGKPLSVHSVQMTHLRAAGYPGEPKLPIDNIVVAIPQNHRVVDIHVTAPDARLLKSDILVAPAQPETPLSMNGPWQPVAPKTDVYLQNTDYPGVFVEKINPQYCRGYRLVSFNLRPVQYNAATGDLYWYETLTARVVTEPVERDTQIVRCRGIETDRNWVKHKVSNPEMIDTYRVEQPVQHTALANSRDNNPYVIITGTEFESAFQTFLSHKQTHGYPGTIVTVDWITANYSGQDDTEKVRNFVIDAYNNWNLEFLLLGGDDDKSNAGGETGDFIVPSRDFYSNTDYMTSDDEIPADMYFACLDGSFNHDGDNLWAEPNDGPDGGEVDWFGEVHVGRACIDSTAEVQGFAAPIMQYENANPDELWSKEAYMIGELLWSDPTYGGDYKDEIRLGSSSHGYTTAGFPDDWTVNTLYDRDLGSEWGQTELYAILNSDNVHIINHLGHSDVNYCMRIYNDNIDNDLTNTIPWLGYSQGCYDGSFDNRGVYSTTTTDCICEHMTTQTIGPFAFIGNSRYGWGEHSSTNGSSQYYDRQFFDAIFGEEIVEIGAANQDSKEDNIGYLDYGANRWCGYELNLFGCPQTCVGGGISSTGMLSLDRATYGHNVIMNVTVRDMDLNQNPGVAETTTVTFTCGTDTETVTLTETGPSSAVFAGAITVINGTASSQNGTVEAAHDDSIICTYIDADDGMGGTNVPVTADVTADFQGPQITNVGMGMVSESAATVTFTTSEMASCRILYGETTPPAIPCNGTLAMAHSVTVDALDPCTFYYFMIEVEDAAGNTTTDDNGGNYYSFQTLDLILMLDEDMDNDPGWSYDGQWAWGVPQGNDGDPSSGYSGDNVVGYNLSGDYTNNLPETYCTTTVIDCSLASQVYFSYWKWLGVESSTYDHATLQISNDGGSSWTDLWDHSGSSVSGGTWEYEEYDISVMAAGNSTVQIRWVMGSTDSSVTYCGWNVDDVRVSYTEECNQPTPTPSNECINNGDVNLSGDITAGDAQICFQIALGSYTPSVEEACAADCNGDESVTAGDAQQVFMTALGTDNCIDPV